MNEYKTIKLSNGQETIVDADVFALLGWINWSVTDHGYVVSGRKTKRHREDFPSILYLHRLLIPPSGACEVDHMNGNKLDNRRENLRLVSRGQNNVNRALRTKYLRGVSRQRGNSMRPYYARITDIRSQPSRVIHLGSFATETDAHEAYKKASSEIHGEFSVFARSKK